jgi:triosephosphate isomerase (TIM)
MREKLIVGNWKMHGSLKENSALLQALLPALSGLRSTSVAVCVPFPYLAQARELLHNSAVAWGAQNLSQYAKGAYTGEVSAAMLGDFACRYAIVGHSERRALFGDTDQIVAEKFVAAQGGGLIPIVCCGETLEERETGMTMEVVSRQLDAVLARAGVAAFANAVIAYEPVWAIGTGRTATPEQAQQVHHFIRARLSALDAGLAQRLQVLYGGSVKAGNTAQLCSLPDVDGGLVGGASLSAEEFAAICRAAVQ